MQLPIPRVQIALVEGLKKTLPSTILFCEFTVLFLNNIIILSPQKIKILMSCVWLMKMHRLITSLHCNAHCLCMKREFHGEFFTVPNGGIVFINYIYFNIMSGAQWDNPTFLPPICPGKNHKKSIWSCRKSWNFICAYM